MIDLGYNLLVIRGNNTLTVSGRQICHLTYGLYIVPPLGSPTYNGTTLGSGLRFEDPRTELFRKH